ncbi:MAG: polysaccharide biosynthesis/export family protein [Gammaproteobacteria bacterium]|nr:polysaccharide biosynthesis/export family protein [Gammaproteobacteria bacterium]
MSLNACAIAPGMRAPDYDKVNINGYDAVSLTSVRDALPKQPASDLANKLSDLNKEPLNKAYRIGPRDIISIIIWNHPGLLSAQADAESNRVAGFQVQQDGTLFFPFAGIINASGKTVEDIRLELTKKLAKVIKTPQIGVSVARFASQRVYVLGEVNTPKLIALQGYPLTVMEAMALAGGVTEHASSNKAYLLRDGKKQEISIGEMLTKGQIQYNIALKDGDVLHFPDNRAEKVYVTGEVQQPREVKMLAGELSLSEALMASGGLDPLAADAKNVYVIRAAETDKPKMFHLNMQEADAFIIGDGFRLQPRDVVYVATAGVTQWNRVLNLIMPSIQSLFYLDVLSNK